MTFSKQISWAKMTSVNATLQLVDQVRAEIMNAAYKCSYVVVKWEQYKVQHNQTVIQGICELAPTEYSHDC